MKSLLTLSFLLLFGGTNVYCQLTWEHTGGPIGGATWYLYGNGQYAFYPDEFYLYRTADGASWEQLPQSALWPIATSGSTLVGQEWQGNTYYYLDKPKLKISHNNGETWSEINYPNGLNYLSEMVMCTHGIYIPVGQDHIILRSQDEGMTWDTMAAPAQYGYDVWAFEDRLYFSGGASELWRTDTNGENWEKINPTFGTSEYINSIFVYQNHILISTDNKVWHSHDGGTTWAFHDTPWPGGYGEFGLSGNTLIATGGGTGIAKSTDYGITWTEIPVNYLQPSSFFGFVSIGDVLLAPHYNHGVVKWNPQTELFEESNNGLKSGAVTGLADNQNEIWAACGNGIFRYDEQQQTWNANTLLPSPVNYYEFIATGDNGLVCASNWLNNGFYISNDHGVTWDSISCESISGDWDYVGWLKIIDNAIFLNTEFGGMYRSMDNGQTWQAINPPFYNKFFKFNNQLIGTDGSTIFVSPDLGSTWNSLASLPLSNVYNLYPAGDKMIASVYVVIGTQQRSVLYASSDGISWQIANDGLPGNDFAGFDSEESARFFKYQDKYFAYDGQYGLFSSNDACQTWFPVHPLKFHSIIQHGDKFYAGGFGGGVIRTTIPTNLYGELAQGTVFKDDNNNGVQDGTETALPNIKVSVDKVPSWYPFYFTTTDNVGHYSLGITPNQQDTLRPWIEANIVENINPPFYIANSGGIKNFGLHLTPGVHDVSATSNNGMRPRPGFDYWSYARVDNLGSENEPTTASLKLDNDLTYINATPAPTSIIGDSLIWDLSTIPVFNGNYILVKTNVPATTPLGTWVINTWRATTTNNDINLSNNVYVTADTVVGSYDPNEKIVEPAEGLTEAEIAAGKELLYTIRFQNTGTFPAERVRITDLLDTALYLPSVRLVAASHPITSFQLKPGGLLEVLFDNIQLPDSTNNEPASHGFVTFAVQRNKAYNKDFPVRNMASIYFDFNEPIFTNEVSFTVNTNNVSSTHEARPKRQEEALLIFPNPTAGSFTVSSKGKLSGQGSLVVLNSMGQMVEERQVGNLSNPIRVEASDLPEGIYFVKIAGGRGFMTGKLVIQHGR